MGLDIKDFFLNTKLKCWEYIQIPIHMIPKEIMDLYKLWPMVYNGYIYAECCKGMYGLPQVGKIASDELVTHLAKYSYAPCEHTPGLWKHESWPLPFCLVVDNFGIQYINKANAEHLTQALKD